jgi:cytochrome b561
MARYHPLLVALHWLIAVLIIIALVFGSLRLSEMQNDDPEKLFALRAHMSIGIAVLFLMLVRLAMRIFSEKPPHATVGHPLADRLGVVTHWLFYLFVFAMAGSGIATASMAGLPSIVFGGSGAPLPEDFSVYPPRIAHGIIATLIGLLLLLHVLAALYHQFVRKDALFRRMWFGDRFE